MPLVLPEVEFPIGSVVALTTLQEPFRLSLLAGEHSLWHDVGQSATKIIPYRDWVINMMKDRRDVLLAVASGSTIAMAGCIGTEQSSDNEPSNSNSTDSLDESQEDSSISSSTTDSSASTSTTSTETQSGNSAINTSPPPEETSESTSSTQADAPTATIPSVGTGEGVDVMMQNGPITISAVDAGSSTDAPPVVAEESLTLKNIGSESVDLAGYTVKYIDAERSYEFPRSSIILSPDDTEKLTTGTAGETILGGPNETFAGMSTPVLNNDGGDLSLLNPQGEVVVKAVY